MRNLTAVLLFSIFLLSKANAEDVLVLDSVDDAIDIDVSNLAREENQKLNQEVEELKKRLENEAIAREVAEQASKDNRSKAYQLVTVRANQISALRAKLAKPPFLYKEIEDDDYNIGYRSIFTGDTSRAVQNLEIFYKKNHAPSLDPDDVSVMKDKAKYIVAEVHVIDNNLKDALALFSEVYVGTNNTRLILLSLFGMATVFETMQKQDELCLTIKRINGVLDQINNIDPSFKLDEEQRLFMQFMQKKYTCNYVDEAKKQESVPEAINQEYEESIQQNIESEDIKSKQTQEEIIQEEIIQEEIIQEEIIESEQESLEIVDQIDSQELVVVEIDQE